MYDFIFQIPSKQNNTSLLYHNKITKNYCVINRNCVLVLEPLWPLTCGIFSPHRPSWHVGPTKTNTCILAQCLLHMNMYTYVCMILYIYQFSAHRWYNENALYNELLAAL